MTTKAFASQADLEEKKVTFEPLSEHAWAHTAEGDPNTGIVIGDHDVLLAALQAARDSQPRTEAPGASDV